LFMSSFPWVSRTIAESRQLGIRLIPVSVKAGG
jgi:hypothetical protein